MSFVCVNGFSGSYVIPKSSLNCVFDDINVVKSSLYIPVLITYIRVQVVYDVSFVVQLITVYSVCY